MQNVQKIAPDKNVANVINDEYKEFKALSKIAHTYL